MTRPTPVVRSAVFQMADRLLEGKLAERLFLLRDAGFSYAEIARRLYQDAGVVVTGETVRTWILRLNLEGAA